MDKYAHITEMENILSSHNELLREMDQLLDALDAKCQEYKSLLEYYYSEQRAQDLEDDAHLLIPDTLHRGVLSEDEIFDLIGDYRDTAMRMLELGVQMLKE